MKLSELKKQIDQISKKAKKSKVDPEVRCVILPKFPSSVTLLNTVLTSLNADFSTDTTGGLHIVYLAENKELNDGISGEVFNGFWGAK